jgi:hypothetical protein
MNPTEENPKLAKKLAKAAAKAAKKKGKVTEPTGLPGAGAPPPAGARSPSERSAEAAERQVALQRWRVVLAVIGAIIAITTLLVMLLRN